MDKRYIKLCKDGHIEKLVFDESVTLDKIYKNLRFDPRNYDSIIIPQLEEKDQKSLFDKVDGYVLKKTKKKKNMYKKSNVWCDGHWPIREIVVRKTKTQEAIVEGIENYIRKIYWLKNVKVSPSGIPYRERG
jgi:hypothetical protein